MKQGTVITKVILFIFLAAVVAYVGYSVAAAIYDPLTTTTAVSCTAGESYNVTLWLAREETPVLTDAYITTLSHPDGSKIAAGGEVARSYRTEQAREQQQELEELQQRLDQLQYTYREGEQVKLDSSTVAELDARISEGVMALDECSAAGELTAAADQAASLRTLVLRRSSSEVDQSLLESNIDALQQQINALTAQVNANSSAVTVTQTGWFSGECDGYETVLTPDALLQADPAGFTRLTGQTVSPSARAIGRLATSITWYAAALVPEEYAGTLSAAGTVQLDLNHSLRGMIPVTVESVSAPQDGQCLVVLSCDDYLQDILHLRTAEAGLVLRLYHGIRVPKQAIRLNEAGQGGVYVVEGANAVFKPVTLLYDNGETYVVEEDRSSTDNLWVGDEIIVSARDLYDGKVVK